MTRTTRPPAQWSEVEADRIAFMVRRDGQAGALEWAKRTYLIYKIGLLQKRSRLEFLKKPSHLTLDRFRAHAIRSCLELRKYIRYCRAEIPV